MFEKASRMKLRFESGKGAITVEDLWDLPLTSNTGKANLDDIARSIHKKLKSEENISFVSKEKPADSVAQLQFEIVKHIINVRLAENETNAKARDNAMKKQRIRELIAERQDDALKGKSLDELQSMIDELS